MGLGTLHARSDGQTINQTWYNELMTALLQDIFPRNASGIVTDLAGGLGNSTYRFSTAFLNTLNIGSGTNPISLSSPTLAAPYSLILPNGLPSSRQPIHVDNTGAMTYGKNPTGQQISSSSGTFTSASASLVDVTNLSISITTSGRPIDLFLIPDTTNYYANGNYIGTSSGDLTISFNRNGATVAQSALLAGSAGLYLSPSAIRFLDTPIAGTYTYKIQVKITGSGTVSLIGCRLVAYEL